MVAKPAIPSIEDMEFRSYSPRLNPKFIEAAKTVMSQEMSTVIFTVKELVTKINMELPVSYRVSVKYMYKLLEKIRDEKEQKRYTENEKKYTAEIQAVFAKYFLEHKEFLFEKLKNETGKNWCKWAWFIERKYPEWNIRQADVSVRGDTDNTVTVIVKGAKKEGEAENETEKAEEGKEVEPKEVIEA